MTTNGNSQNKPNVIKNRKFVPNFDKNDSIDPYESSLGGYTPRDEVFCINRPYTATI